MLNDLLTYGKIVGCIVLAAVSLVIWSATLFLLVQRVLTKKKKPTFATPHQLFFAVWLVILVSLVLLEIDTFYSAKLQEHDFPTILMGSIVGLGIGLWRYKKRHPSVSSVFNKRFWF